MDSLRIFGNFKASFGIIGIFLGFFKDFFINLKNICWDSLRHQIDSMGSSRIFSHSHGYFGILWDF